MKAVWGDRNLPDLKQRRMETDEDNWLSLVKCMNVPAVSNNPNVYGSPPIITVTA